MKKTIITALFVTSLVIANVVTGKILMIGGLVLPGAVLLYAITFLMTDLMSELYGKEEAQKLVKAGFVAAVFASIMIYFTQLLPVAPFASETQNAYNVLLGMNIRFVIASMSAYYVSQSWDVWFFHYIGKRTKGGKKWLRNNASTATSQLIDTLIFITIAFAGSVPNLLLMIISQYVVKLGIAILDTPFFYLITNGNKNTTFGNDLGISVSKITNG